MKLWDLLSILTEAYFSYPVDERDHIRVIDADGAPITTVSDDDPIALRIKHDKSEDK